MAINAICWTLRVSYKWKYVHVEAVCQRHLSGTKSLKCMKVRKFLGRLTMPKSVTNRLSIMGESMYDLAV
jgi:hypothetical protein